MVGIKDQRKDYRSLVGPLLGEQLAHADNRGPRLELGILDVSCLQGSVRAKEHGGKVEGERVRANAKHTRPVNESLGNSRDR